MKKLSRLAVMLALMLALTACSGGADTPSPDEQTEGQHPVTDAAELEGQWTSPSGNILSFSADQGRYTYQTFSGRTGQEVTAQRSARCFAAPARAQTMTSFSFARVMATYSTRSSSALASRRS